MYDYTESEFNQAIALFEYQINRMDYSIPEALQIVGIRFPEVDKCELLEIYYG